MQRRVATLRDLEIRALVVAHHLQIAGLQALHRPACVRVVELVALTVELHRVFLNGVRTRRRQRVPDATRAGDEAEDDQNREKLLHGYLPNMTLRSATGL